LAGSSGRADLTIGRANVDTGGAVESGHSELAGGANVGAGAGVTVDNVAGETGVVVYV
jgi:hypothetical protein